MSPRFTVPTLNPLTVLVCGGRDYRNGPRVMKTLTHLEARFNLDKATIHTIIEGGASGADALGRIWAMNNGRNYRTFRAEWSKYGRSAGYRRNQMMIDIGRPHYAVVFPGGRGTADMLSRIKHHEIPHLIVSETSKKEDPIVLPPGL